MLWTYEHPYVYFIDNKLLVSSFYIFNSLIGFAFLIMYMCIYSSTVHRLENSLTEMANMDPLTGISNRRKMQEMLKYVLEEYETQRHQKSQEAVVQEFDDLRQQIQDTVIEYNNDKISITVTIGLAFYEKGKTINNLIKEADENLYEGKNAGRNRVYVKNC